MYVCLFFSLLFFFFFKQKTAYEMRISDWSSDVCSSDLLLLQPQPPAMPAVPLLPVEAQALPAPAGPVLEPTPVALRPTVHIAAETAAQNAVVPAGPAETQPAAIDFSASIQLANDTGRRPLPAPLQPHNGGTQRWQRGVHAG